MEASITILPTSPESTGEMVRRFARMGYSLSNHRGRIVARRSVVVRLRRSAVDEVFEWLADEVKR
jgi:hypothetical protein